MTDKKGISDMIKGTASRAKGEVKDHLGKAFGNQKMQHEGKQSKLKGARQQKTGETIDNEKNNDH